MKCGRCNKELGQANTHNAHYIKNANDPKTYGNDAVDEFTLTKTDNTTEVSTDFKTLNSKLLVEHIAIDDAIVVKTNEISIVKTNLDKEVDISLKEILLSSYEKKLIELSNLQPKKQTVRITSKSTVKSIPKTLIVCKECKLDNDTIIW